MNLPYAVPIYKTEYVLDVAALIQNLQLIIKPDTSIVHIASAFNIPIVSIHGKIIKFSIYLNQKVKIVERFFRI